VGASGAISAALGAYVYLFPQRRIYIMFFFMLKRIPAVWYLGIWLALQVVFASIGGPGVAWWAHIGGFIIGLALAYLHRAAVRRRLVAAAARLG
jgi:membrane associated rhomboid family serine protease